ncbi:hypothetical protein [Streptomyces sp. NPDC090112]|uniref:hypothetical protein n=1 Tax=Streptomyces sp. NPDC090112 TaxID=3365949 RepID=UPI00382D67FD
MNLDRELLLLDSRRIDGLGSILDAPQHQKSFRSGRDHPLEHLPQLVRHQALDHHHAAQATQPAK